MPFSSDDSKQLQSTLSILATKADLDRMEARLIMKLSLLQRDSNTRLDQHEQRISQLEQARS
jgi:hypothetical protein